MSCDQRSDIEVVAPTSPLSVEAFEALLALADDELVMGHRYSEWLGLSPFLEEDLTLASIAQDELGHARSLYELIWPTWDNRDALVVRRPQTQWRSCALVELDNAAWEDLLVRHWLYDLAEVHRWDELIARFGPQVRGLTAVGTKALSEERFHRRHSHDLVSRLVVVDSARRRLVDSFDRFEPFVSALAYGMSMQGALNFSTQIVDDLFRGERPTDRVLEFTVGIADGSSRRTRHHDFGSVAQSLVDVVAFDPTATW